MSSSVITTIQEKQSGSIKWEDFATLDQKKKNNASFQWEDVVTVLCDSVTLQKNH